MNDDDARLAATVITPEPAARLPFTGAGSRGPQHVLVVRLDSAGDVLLAGPAVRAVTAGPARVVLLAGPRSRPAAQLLLAPGAGHVIAVAWQALALV